MLKSEMLLTMQSRSLRRFIDGVVSSEIYITARAWVSEIS